MRRSLIAAFIAPLALLLYAAPACQSVPPIHEQQAKVAAEDSDSNNAEAAEVVERMLAVSVAGQHVGVVETRLEKAEDGTWTTKEKVTFSLIREGGGDDAQFSSTTESVAVFNAEHELVTEREVEREAGVTITREVTREGDEMVSSYTGPGHETPEVKRFEIPASYRSPLVVNFELLEEWQRTGEPATTSFSTFDPERERFELSELTLVGETEYEHGGERIPAYVFRVVEEDGTVIDTITDHDFLPLKLDAAGTFMASLVDEAPSLGEGQVGRINSELPVSGETTPAWWELAEQEITVEVEGDDDPNSPALWEDGHYHEVEREGPRYQLTLLSTRPPADFSPPSLPLKISDPEIARYLEPTAMAQSDSAMIKASAEAIVAGESDSIVAAEKIVEAVFTGIEKKAGVRGSATATEVLQNAAGDCTEHAVLVVALMRAAGIPARVVDGIVMASHKDGSGVAGYHAWAEIWLGRWIGVDATVGETGTSARYLQFGIDEPGEIGSGGKMMRSIGKTKIELGPHKTYEQMR